MTGWKLTRRGDYINGDLANRTRAAVVALERSGLGLSLCGIGLRARTRAGAQTIQPPRRRWTRRKWKRKPRRLSRTGPWPRK